MYCELQIPDHQWSIELTREDADRFIVLMGVTSRVETDNEVVWLKVAHQSKYWFAAEPHNVLWGRVDSTDVIDQLMIPFSSTALNSLFNFLMTHEKCEFTVEVDEIPRKHVAVFRALGGDFFYANVPTVTENALDLFPQGDVTCELGHSQLHLIGDFMRSWPSGISTDGHTTPFLPAFAHLVVDESGLRCSMDWTRYGGSLNTLGVATTATGTGSVQFEPSIISRVLARPQDDTTMTLTFNSVSPKFVYFHNDDWGFRADAARESVVRWGSLVTACLKDEPEVDGDKWNSDEVIPTLAFTFRDVDMSVSIISDSAGCDDYLRVAMNVASNVVFNLELMQELNTYNNMTVGVVAVFNDDGVYLVTDVPCSGLRLGIPRAIRRLHDRRHDLVAMVAMYGDGPTLFDDHGHPTV